VEIEIVSDPNDMKAAFNLITGFSVSIRTVANNMLATVVLAERPDCGLSLRHFRKISLHNNIPHKLAYKIYVLVWASLI
jgi:hypothetical protein